jgi:glutamate racemase
VIGVVDWGIGGLGFFKLLRERHPRLPLVYVSDAGETPYGKLPASHLAARLRQIGAFMRSQGVTHLVVACNAASTALPALGVHGVAGSLATAAGRLLVTGVVAHGIRLVRATPARSVGIVGGRRTVRSGIYRRALANRRRTIWQRVAQPLSGRIEAGDLGSRALRDELASILGPLRAVDALLLACTHYPAIAEQFAALLPGARLLDPARAMLAWIEARWLAGAERKPTLPRRSADRVLTTGSPERMRSSAAQAFGVTLGAVECLHVRTLRPRRR